MKTPPPSLGLVALLVLGAVGLSVVFLAVFDSTSWPLLIAGLVAVMVSMAGVWTLQRGRDRTLR